VVKSVKQQGSNSELYGKMQVVFVEMDTTPTVSISYLIIDRYLCVCVPVYTHPRAI